MENKPNYQEIKDKLEADIQQANMLTDKQERIEFIGEASLKLQKQQKEGLLSEEESRVLSLKLAYFAKEAFSTFDLLDDLSTESWLRH